MDLEAIYVPTLHDVVSRHALERPERIAIRFGTSTLTYAALDRLTDRVAASLLRDGVGSRDRVVFIGRNSNAVPVLALGANKIGAVPTPLNWRLAAAEVRALIDDAQASLVFAEPEFEAMASALQEEGAVFKVIPAREVTSGSWLTEGPAPDPSSDPTAVAIQIYTSGTTGVPKGVMLPHRSLLGVNVMRKHVPWDSWGAEDVTLVSAPLGHIGAYGMLARSLFFGGEAVIQESFEAGATLDAIQAHGVSKIALVPTAIRMLLDHPRVRQVDYGRIDTMIYGASPITASLLQEAMAVFGCQFAQSYGMTETSGPIVALAPADHDEAGSLRMGAAGQALPGSEIGIVDADGRVLGPGEDGEIAVRSVANMSGYWNRPRETAAVMSTDGWLRTGDAGRMDADGYLYVRARVKDMIVSGAENIYPAEVETAVASHPSVAEVAVIGVPDARWGEAVKAIVVPRAGQTLDPAAVIAWARERIAGYKLPKSIDVVGALPLNGTGKVNKRALRAVYWAGQDREVN